MQKVSYIPVPLESILVDDPLPRMSKKKVEFPIAEEVVSSRFW